LIIDKNNDCYLDLTFRFSRVYRYAWAFVAIFVFLIIIYGNSFDCAWHLDDFPNIIENQNVHLHSLSWDNIKKSFYGLRYDQQKINRPLSYLSFALNYYLNGSSVFGYHLVNFTIHYLAAIFLFLLLYNTLQLPRWQIRFKHTDFAIALFSTLFWAVHPIQVAAVTYIVQRMASMAGMFYVMGMYFYLKGRTSAETQKRIGFFVLSFGCTACAIASKENAFMLPISILLYEALLLQGFSGRKIKPLFKIFLFALFCVLAVILIFSNRLSILGSYANRPFTIYERLLTEPRVIVFYISLLFYPVNSRLMLLHDFEISRTLFSPWSTLPCLLIIFLMIAGAFRLRRHTPIVCFSILFFLLNHLIEGSIVPLELIFEHRNYIPSMFFFVPPAIIWVKIHKYFARQKSIQTMMSFTVIFVLAAQAHTTYVQNQYFKNDLTLWMDNTAKAPNLHRPRHNLGKALLIAGHDQAGLREMQKALAARTGGTIDQKYLTHYNLGIYYLYHNNYDNSLSHLLKSLDLQPNNYKAYQALATVMLYRNALNQAEKYIARALQLNPYAPEAYNTLGLIRLKQGDTDSALKSGEKALSLNPSNGQPYFLIGEVHRFENNFILAEFYYKKYLEQYPEQIQANLALIELYDLMHNSSSLKKSIFYFMRMAGDKNIAELLVTYREKYNYLDDSRIRRIIRAIVKSAPRQADALNRLLKTKKEPGFP